MNKFITLGLSSAALLTLGACDDGLIDTGDTDNGGDAFCMETSEGNDFPDIFPSIGAPSSVGDEVYAECEPYTGAVYIAYAPAADCAGDTWDFVVEHYGTSAQLALYMHDRGANNSASSLWWGERHPITTGSSGPNGWYERYEATLAPSASSGAVQVGSTTWHKCASNNDSTIVFGYEILSDDNTVLDCVVLGLDNPQARVDAFLEAYPSFETNGCAIESGWFEGP